MAAATRDRVRAVADELDFRPDPLARSFATGRAELMGLLSRDALEPFAIPVLAGVSLTFGEDDRAVLMRDARDDAARLRDHARALAARRVDGVLVLGNGPGRLMPSVTPTFRAPVVYAYELSDDPEDVCFIPDGVQMGGLAAEHLMDVGSWAPVHITGAADDLSVQEREQGFTLGLTGRGVDLAEPVLHVDWTAAGGYRAATSLVERGVDFDAMFCGNDQLALGVLACLTAHGVDVPGSVRVMGVDNVEDSTSGRGFLTTIDRELMELGGRAAQALTDLVAGTGRLSGVQRTPCRLVQGHTTVSRDGKW
ncbi:LacI family DNA-binding transcriptional regulator [Mariniluteicoccus flavus]